MVVEPDLVKIVPHYDPSEKAVWFQVSRALTGARQTERSFVENNENKEQSR